MQPEKRSEGHARAEDPLAASSPQAWRVCNDQWSTPTENWPMLTPACQWHPGAATLSASTMCACSASLRQWACSAAVGCVACPIEPRKHAGEQHCTHRSVRLVVVPHSVGMVPVNKLKSSSLQHATRTHGRRRAQPEAQSERHARAENPLAAAAPQAWRVCNNQHSTPSQG